jgi:hypothetical protein
VARRAVRYLSQQRFGMCRGHVLGPVAFDYGLRVTIQDLGWHEDRTYRKRRDDVASLVTRYHAPATCIPARGLILAEMEV